MPNTAKPTALKILEGNPGKRAINHREPKPVIGVPDCPAWVSEAGRRHWPALVGLISDMGVMTIADGSAAALLCNALGEYLDACERVDELGVLVEEHKYDKDGNEVASNWKPNPAAVIRSDSWRRVYLMMQQFGLTPSSRSKLHVEKPAEVDEFTKEFG